MKILIPTTIIVEQHISVAYTNELGYLTYSEYIPRDKYGVNSA
jgi:hypothetical protein